jgi:hypothetical protein
MPNRTGKWPRDLKVKEEHFATCPFTLLRLVPFHPYTAALRPNQVFMDGLVG